MKMKKVLLLLCAGLLIASTSYANAERSCADGESVTGTTWYHHDLWPNFYWGLISDDLIRRIHLRVLDHIKDKVE